MTDHALAVLGGFLGGAVVTALGFVYYIRPQRHKESP